MRSARRRRRHAPMSATRIEARRSGADRLPGPCAIAPERGDPEALLAKLCIARERLTSTATRR